MSLKVNDEERKIVVILKNLTQARSLHQNSTLIFPELAQKFSGCLLSYIFFRRGCADEAHKGHNLYSECDSQKENC